MIAHHGGGWLLALSVASAAPGLAADSPIGTSAAEVVLADPQPQPWGGSSDAVIVIGVGDITPPNSNIAYETSVTPANGIGVYVLAASPEWWYQFHVPSGALLQRVELEACDVGATVAISFGMTRGVAPAGSMTTLGQATTGTVQTPGCAFFSATPFPATTINNAGNNYWVFFNWTGAAGNFNSVVVHAFRIYYRLQVSPAPAVATFPSDVPTSHPFFRFVEALAAAGVTGGCGAGSYCPDQAVTRGQMAVFLATALGLHFHP